MTNLLNFINSVKSSFSAMLENAVVVNKNIADENTTVLSNSVNLDLTNGLNFMIKNIIT